jgi:mannose-6-phosphate isomerase-like protein (cupin superfamily)
MIPDAIRPPKEYAAPAFVWEQDLASGASVSFPKSSEFDVLGVTLAGTVALATDETKEDRALLAPWRAFVAPGGGITVAAKNGAARVVLVIATSGESVLAARLTAATVWRQRPAPVVDVDLTGETDLAWAKGAYHARIGFAAPTSRRASLGVLRMSAEAPVAAHRHDQEWEHMAILQGDGDFVQGSAGDERSTHATDGTTVTVPPGIRHEWRPKGSRPFLGIQLYTPPGPEQRFKKLAAAP